MTNESFFPRGAIVVLIWAMAPGLALAYIDPGNGAYMVQALFTVVGAALFYLRHPVRSLLTLKERLFSRWTQSQASAPQDTLPEASDLGVGVSDARSQESLERH
jgi:hypothetical protein